MGKAQERIAECLAGTLPHSELSEAEQSAIRIHVYFRASAILDLPHDKMKQAGKQLPPDIRDLVREECKRLLKHRALE